MASQSLISTVNGYENYIKDKGKDEQVINAYVDACSVVINGEKDIEYGLQLTKRAKGLIEDFCTAKTGGTIWDLEKYAFDHKTTYELINKKYEVLLLEAQNKIVDSYFQYIEKKREPKDRFYMPRRKQLIKIGLVDALQGMIDDKYDILCVSLVPGAGKSTIEKFFHSAVAGWFPKDYSLFYSHSGDITRMYYDGVYDIGSHKDNMCIVAMRGRNPNNPSDRTAGSLTEQRLEVNMQGTSNCLTSVQKDNLLLENNIQKVGQISSNGSQCGTVISDNGISANLVAGTHGYANSHIATQYRIRKLTPRECGRLMGVSDEDIDKMAVVNSNTQLYKQFGNSIVVDVMCAMFKNLNIKQGDSNEALQAN